MRVPVAVVTGAVTVCRASGPGDRVVADSLDAEQAPVGQSRKSLVSVMVVSVRGAFPYCLIVVGCRPRAGSG